ncbi:MAG: HD domain-containing protein [Desulfobacula sp.]|uniref:HD domain-containing protein n=1 Tax=Desulfobacula sp. TaxID=2593537 RepID=UPI0025BF21BC|nr:HD domain-containing protein [Desulfobacula sp.]MCD4720360.1 HD domain-containing protein [Desulfobacula sp.]
MKCPGQDTQYWNKDAIFETKCPECGHPMEFFKDDATRRCANCKKKIVNPRMDFGCASYCKFAEQCLGTLPEEFIAQRDDLLKDRVAVEMKRYMGTDFKRIGHTAKVANFAEKIGKKERANLAVVLCAAYLYDIGVKNVLENHDSIKPEYMEKESPKVARELMEKLGAKEELINEVIDIVGHHNRPAQDDSLNRKVLHDADMLTHMVSCEGKNGVDDKEFFAKLDRLFLTTAGNELAKQVLRQTN